MTSGRCNYAWYGGIVINTNKSKVGLTLQLLAFSAPLQPPTLGRNLHRARPSAEVHRTGGRLDRVSYEKACIQTTPEQVHTGGI